jgi:hypothetical protein
VPQHGVSPHALLWWAIAVLLVVVLVLAGAQAARALREWKRVQARVDGYADLPVVKALAVAERDLRRIEGALAQIAPLVARTQAALVVIRRGPVPPELTAAIRRVRAEVGAFRTFARR